jgi:predicted short-subunit dehydrogenase-like oxidoreductase (DUF2520 family)
MKSGRHLNIAIIGAGKVGTVLGRLLVENGEKIVCVVSRSEASARKAGKFLRCKRVSTSLDSIPPTVDVIFISTPHGAVRTVASDLAKLESLKYERLSACHASGMLTADALSPLQHRGAKVFSFHPLQTFPRDFEPRDIVKNARGIYYGVDGSPAALKVSKVLARKLDGKVIEINPEMRAFYHAACVVASNHLTAMLAILESMFQTLRTTEKKFYPVFKPIVYATLNNIEFTSPTKALSGPVARGGVETVADHFASIEAYQPDLISYFAALSLETVKLAESKGSINQVQASALRSLFQSYTNKDSQLERMH